MRLTIPDLAIGKAYQAQVRAKSGTEVGQWSPILDIPAVYETTTPADLIGSDISVAVGTGNSGDTFIATWTYTQPKDFDHYEYRWYGSSDNSTYVRSIIFSTTTPSATLTFSENTSLFGAPKSWMKIEVRAVNTSGLTSPNWVVSSTPVQQLAPSTPTGFTAVSGPDVIKLEWLAPVPDLQNIEYYKIEVSIDGATYIEAAKVKYPTLKYSYDTTYYDKRHDFRISSINKFGRTSSTLALTGGSVKVSTPSVMNGLISNIVSYSRATGSSAVTYVTKDPHGLSSSSKIYVHGTRSKAFSVTSITGNGQLTATTSAAHGFSTGNTFEIVGSSNDIFNERGIINAVTTNTFSYASSSSGTFVSPATAYVVDGTSTVDTIFGEPVLPTIISPTSISCYPNSGTGGISVVSQTYLITSCSGTGGVATYTYTGSPSILPGQRVTIQDVSPDQYNLTDALVISTPTSSTFTIQSEADGSFVLAGYAITRPFGDIYPSDNAVRIKDDGITIGNMGTGFIVGISPTSFNMQSSGSSTRLALSSSHIDMYKNGDKTVQFDGNTGDATIVGKFSTGFPPAARVELDSGSDKPEAISFYSSLPEETLSGSIGTNVDWFSMQSNSLGMIAITSNNQQLNTEISSYTRTAGSALTTFTTSSPHGLKSFMTVIIQGTTGCNTTSSVVVTVTSTTQFTCSPNASTTAASGSTGFVKRSRIYMQSTVGYGTSGVVDIDGANISGSFDEGKIYYTSKGSSNTAVVRSISGSGTAGISGTGAGTRTATTTVAHGFQVGDSVYITGVTGIASEVAVVATVTSFTFTYTSVNSGTRTGTGGTITLYPSLKEASNIPDDLTIGGSYIVTDDAVNDRYYYGQLDISPPISQPLQTGPPPYPLVPEPGVSIRSIGTNTADLLSESEIIISSNSLIIFADSLDGLTGNAVVVTPTLMDVAASISVNGKTSSQTEESPGAYLGSNGVNIFSRSGGAAITAHRYASPAGNNTNYTVLQFGYNGVTANVGVLTLNSSTLDLSVYNYSDYRLKDNIVPLSGAIEKMKMAKTYTFTKNFDTSNTEVTGFLAHELSEVLPYAVQGEKDQVDLAGEPVYQTVDHVALIPLISQAVHDLIYKVEALENQINQQNI